MTPFRRGVRGQIIGLELTLNHPSLTPPVKGGETNLIKRASLSGCSLSPRGRGIG